MPHFRQGLLWPGITVSIALAMLLSLGAWQMQRRAWKSALIAEREARIAAPPIPLPVQLGEAGRLEEIEFRRVSVSGVFDHARELAVRGQSLGQQSGFHLIAPLQLADGDIVLIDRGFVPYQASAAAERPAGAVTLTGLLRGAYGRNRFTPADRPEVGEWFAIDPLAMGQALGLPAPRPYLIDLDAKPAATSLPIGGQSRVELPNDHLHYALTWYGLAVSLLVVFYRFARQRPGSG